jgi:hypothetical protein
MQRIGRGFGLRIEGYSRFRRVLDVLASSGTPPFFIQIGANNGIDFDDLYEGVVTHRMPGLVVEPIKSYFDTLQHVYARYPGVVPVRAAIHPTAKQMTMYFVDPSHVRVEWQHGVASFDRAHLLKHGVAEEGIREEHVESMSFAELLKRVPSGRSVDVLAIDTEGFDHEILKMIDLDAMQPKVARFEALHMKSDDLLHWQQEFRRRGYDVKTDAYDCVAIHRSVTLNVFARATSRLRSPGMPTV